MAAPRRREACLPNGETLRLPPINVKSVPSHATIFKAKMHDEIVSMFSNGSSTIRFDDKSLNSGLLCLHGDSYAFEALRNVRQPGNPMDLLFSIDANNHIALNGKITNTINVGRAKVDPNARRRKTSPPAVQKKRTAASLDPDKNGSSGTRAAAAPKRQRVSGMTGAMAALRSTKPSTARPVSSLNGFGAGGSSSSPSPHVSPGRGGGSLNGFRSKSRSITPPTQGSTSIKRSVPSNARASPAQSASSPGSSSGTTTQRGLSAERERKLRYGIIHLLALDDTPVQKLRDRLLNPNDSPIGDRTFLNIVRKVSKHSKAGYVLKEEFWEEVEENCVLYSEPDRKRLRDVLAKRERRKGAGVVRTGRIGVGGTVIAPPMIVDDRSSNNKISEALERFDNRVKKNLVIRNAKDEDDARSLFKAYHSVYLQVNKRMEEIRERMTDFHTKFNQVGGKEQARIAEKIEKYYNENLARHDEYRTYLPKLHVELKSILKRLENYVEAN